MSHIRRMCCDMCSPATYSKINTLFSSPHESLIINFAFFILSYFKYNQNTSHLKPYFFLNITEEKAFFGYISLVADEFHPSQTDFIRQKPYIIIFPPLSLQQLRLRISHSPEAPRQKYYLPHLSLQAPPPSHNVR